MRNLTIETTRFLNHIEREQEKAVEPLKIKNEILSAELYSCRQREKSAVAENNLLGKDIERLKSKLETETIVTDNFLGHIKKLLGKIRLDIYSKKTSTPRWFKTGKWWSRETGYLDQEFIAEMTKDELLEAFEFYCDTDLSFMLRSSIRDELSGFETAQNLWYKYESLTDSEKENMTFPQFCGKSATERKQEIIAETKLSEQLQKEEMKI